MSEAEKLLALATAASTARLPGESEIVWANRTFNPSFPGVHFCGADHDANDGAGRCFTIWQQPTRTDEDARKLFEAARSVGEVDKSDADFLVDLNTHTGHEDDFWSNRQMAPAMIGAIARALTKDTTP